MESLCDYIGVIAKGRLVSQGPLDALRMDAGRGATLEEVFIDLVGAGDVRKPALEWLVREQ